MRSIALTLISALFLGGCGGELPGEDAAPADTMTAVAQAAYDPAAFDSISWETNPAAIERGAVVYNSSCLKCHGDRGLGDANFVRHGDTLTPPSFRDPDWIYANDKEGLREKIFVGTGEEMPHWGIVPLRPRDIDAVAIYILQSMRGN